MSNPDADALRARLDHIERLFAELDAAKGDLRTRADVLERLKREADAFQRILDDHREVMS